MNIKFSAESTKSKCLSRRWNSIREMIILSFFFTYHYFFLFCFSFSFSSSSSSSSFFKFQNIRKHFFKSTTQTKKKEKLLRDSEINSINEMLSIVRGGGARELLDIERGGAEGTNVNWAVQIIIWNHWLIRNVVRVEIHSDPWQIGANKTKKRKKRKRRRRKRK